MKNSSKFYSVKNKIKILYLWGILLFFSALVFGIFFGSTELSFSEIKYAFKYGFDMSADGRIFAYVRIPRTVASLVCGAAFSVSGAVIQAVLANRLASPNIIGVNSGAGLAVTLCTAIGISSGLSVSVSSFIGAFTSVMLVSLGARKWGVSRGTVILIGVAMNSLLGAVSDSIITFIPEAGVMSNDFKIGEFSCVTYQKLIPASVLITIAFFVLLSLSNELDVLTLGEDTAKSLGMNTSLMRTVFLLLAALLAGCAVSVCGLLSFVGLMVPHVIKRLAGSKSSRLLPLCALFGSAFVCICDSFARIVFSPYEVPVGIIMAFLGAPFFVFILVKGKGGHRND